MNVSEFFKGEAMNDDPMMIARALPKVIEVSMRECTDLSLMQMQAVFRVAAETMQQAQMTQELALTIASLRNSRK